MESNDSPKIPDRGETSDIPGLPLRGLPNTDHYTDSNFSCVSKTSLQQCLHKKRRRKKVNIKVFVKSGAISAISYKYMRQSKIVVQ